MPRRTSALNSSILGLVCVLNFTVTAHAAEALGSYTPFTGVKTTWHGFDRYDFVMDESDLSIKPLENPGAEKSSVTGPPKGRRRCVSVVEFITNRTN